MDRISSDSVFTKMFSKIRYITLLMRKVQYRLELLCTNESRIVRLSLIDVTSVPHETSHQMIIFSFNLSTRLYRRQPFYIVNDRRGRVK